MVTFSSDAQLVFFNKVFGATHGVTERVKALLATGVTFEVSLYSLSAYTDGGKTALGSVYTTYGTTSLMKGTAEAVVTDQNKTLISEWVSDVYVKQGAPAMKLSVPATLTLLGTVHPLPNVIVVIKAIRNVTGLHLAESKALAQQVLAGQSVDITVNVPVAEAVTVLMGAGITTDGLFAIVGEMGTAASKPVVVKVEAPKPPVEAPKPVDEVIALKTAQALGQKVHGTSSGSVYHCIALGEHVRLAAKLAKSGSISIRAEWTDDPTDDLKKLQDAGVMMKQGYGSIHFDAADVPLWRVVGAFIVGTGIAWKSAVMNGADLVIGESK